MENERIRAQHDATNRRWTRRALLASTGASLIAGLVVLACSQASAPVSPTSAPASASQAIPTQATAATQAPAPAQPVVATKLPVTPTGASQAPLVTTKPKAGQAVHLNLTNFSIVEVATIFNSLVDQFQKENPDISVTYTPTTDNYFPKLLTQAAGGLLPDVFWMNAQNLGAWVVRNQLLDLTPVAKAANYDFQDFWKAGIDAYSVKGELMALPGQVNDRALFFNQALFQTAGIKPPPLAYGDTNWNFQAFVDAAKALTIGAGTRGAAAQYGCLVPDSFIFYAPWIWANGGDFMNADRTEAMVTAPATVEAFQFLQDLIYKYKVAPTPAVLSTENGLSLFATGKIGMATEELTQITFLRKNAEHFNWDTGLLPAGRAGFANQSSGPGWAIGKSTKFVDQSWKLASFLVSADAETKLAAGGAALPSRISVAQQIWGHPTMTPLHGNIFLDGLHYVKPNPFVWNWSEIENMLIKELAYLWDGSQTAEKVMQTIKPQMDKLLQTKPS